MPNPNCTVPECGKPARSSVATLCPMHYHRQYRHGSTEATFTHDRFGTERQYRMVTDHGHPLAMSSGRVYVHRKNLYDRIGGGTHPCHWCGASLTWGLGKGVEGNLVADHLNGDKGDNTPTNLVPSCNGCNSGRAQQARSEQLRETHGMWSGNDTIANLTDPSQRRRPRLEPSAKS